MRLVAHSRGNLLHCPNKVLFSSKHVLLRLFKLSSLKFHVINSESSLKSSPIRGMWGAIEAASCHENKIFRGWTASVNTLIRSFF